MPKLPPPRPRAAAAALAHVRRHGLPDGYRPCPPNVYDGDLIGPTKFAPYPAPPGFPTGYYVVVVGLPAGSRLASSYVVAVSKETGRVALAGHGSDEG